MSPAIAPRDWSLKEQPILDNAAFPTPQRLIVRQIDIDIGGGNFNLIFRSPDKAHPVASLPGLIQKIEHTQYPNQQPVQAYHRPLDLNIIEPSMVLLFLSFGWGWRYSHQRFGVTLGENVDQSCYANLRHVLNGVSSPTPFGHNAGRCRIVHFLAKPDGGNFAHSINFNVELVHQDVFGDPPNTTPLVIDPDIRNPGGSLS
jgi:hypothetical protein